METFKPKSVATLLRIHWQLWTELSGNFAPKYAPHHPEEGKGVYKRDCDCRKPAPGQLLDAAEEHDIDLASSFMVGDHYLDVEAGIAAGCRTVMLLTGHGTHELERLDDGEKARVDCVAEDLAKGVDWILSQG